MIQLFRSQMRCMADETTLMWASRQTIIHTQAVDNQDLGFAARHDFFLIEGNNLWAVVSHQECFSQKIGLHHFINITHLYIFFV